MIIFLRWLICRDYPPLTNGETKKEMDFYLQGLGLEWARTCPAPVLNCLTMRRGAGIERWWEESVSNTQGQDHLFRKTAGQSSAQPGGRRQSQQSWRSVETFKHQRRGESAWARSCKKVPVSACVGCAHAPLCDCSKCACTCVCVCVSQSVCM